MIANTPEGKSSGPNFATEQILPRPLYNMLISMSNSSSYSCLNG